MSVHDKFRFFETDEALELAVATLRSLGKPVIKILEKIVEEQIVERTAVSNSVNLLWDCGFVFVRDQSDLFTKRFDISSSLSGEEALAALLDSALGCPIHETLLPVHAEATTSNSDTLLATENPRGTAI